MRDNTRQSWWRPEYRDDVLLWNCERAGFDADRTVLELFKQAERLMAVVRELKDNRRPIYVFAGTMAPNIREADLSTASGLTDEDHANIERALREHKDGKP